MPDRRALQRAYVRAVVARLVAAPIISPAVETRLRAQVARLQAEEAQQAAQAKLEEARWHVGINRLLHAIYTPADAETPGQSPPKPPAVDEP